MGRKKKSEDTPPQTVKSTCEFCGAELQDGRRCKCREAIKQYAKELYERYYGGNKNDDE